MPATSSPRCCWAESGSLPATPTDPPGRPTTLPSPALPAAPAASRSPLPVGGNAPQPVGGNAPQPVRVGRLWPVRRNWTRNAGAGPSRPHRLDIVQRATTSVPCGRCSPVGPRRPVATRIEQLAGRVVTRGAVDLLDLGIFGPGPAGVGVVIEVDVTHGWVPVGA